MNSTQPFVTPEPRYLAQYYELRRRQYRQHYPWLNEDFGPEEPLDMLSHIAVLCDANGDVIAGSRLTVSTPENPLTLPLEEGGFSLKQAFPGWLAGRAYAEISRYAAERQAGHGSAGLELSRALCLKAVQLNVDLIFALCPPGPSKLNRIHARKLGVQCHTFPDIAVPTHYGGAMSLHAFTGIAGVRRNGVAA